MEQQLQKKAEQSHTMLVNAWNWQTNSAKKHQSKHLQAHSPDTQVIVSNYTSKDG